MITYNNVPTYLRIALHEFNVKEEPVQVVRVQP
jgi:hypothetical protein